MTDEQRKQIQLEERARYFQYHYEIEKTHNETQKQIINGLRHEIIRLKVEIKRRDAKLTRIYEEQRRKEDDLK